MRTMKCSELILDGEIYPRASIDSHHVGEMVEAARAGVKFPPAVIDKKTRRVVDGAHRVKMRQRIDGPHAEIEVVEKSYESDHDLFLDAVRLNASHGRILSTYDKAHCLIVAKNLSIDPAAVATALNMTVNGARELLIDRSATAAGKGLTAISALPIKKTIRHMAGKPLTKAQVEANDKLGGMEQLFYVNQLILLIETSLLDTANAELMGGIGRLKALLNGMGAPKTSRMGRTKRRQAARVR